MRYLHNLRLLSMTVKGGADTYATSWLSMTCGSRSDTHAPTVLIMTVGVVSKIITQPLAAHNDGVTETLWYYLIHLS